MNPVRALARVNLPKIISFPRKAVTTPLAQAGSGLIRCFSSRQSPPPIRAMALLGRVGVRAILRQSYSILNPPSL